MRKNRLPVIAFLLSDVFRSRIISDSLRLALCRLADSIHPHDARHVVANTPVCVVSDCSINQTLQMCSDGAGGVIIAWGDKRKEKTSTGGDIFAQRLNAEGIPQWTTNGVMICDTTGEQNMPTILSDGAGGAYIAWVDAHTGQYTGNIYLQHIKAAGQTLWERQGKQITTGNAWFNPSMTTDGSGGVFLAYRYGVTPAGIYAQRVTSAGTLQYAGNGVAVSPSGYHDNPKAVADDSSGVFIAWIYTRGDGLWNGYIQRLTASGTKRYCKKSNARFRRNGFCRFPYD